jgi:hypothetical protein
MKQNPGAREITDLKRTNLSSILFFFPSKVASAIARTLVERSNLFWGEGRGWKAKSKRISKGIFAVTQAFPEGLKALWEHEKGSLNYITQEMRCKGLLKPDFLPLRLILRDIDKDSNAIRTLNPHINFPFPHQ